MNYTTHRKSAERKHRTVLMSLALSRVPIVHSFPANFFDLNDYVGIRISTAPNPRVLRP